VRAIRRVIAQGRQAILLVPEIALATQTLSRLLARLPRVAVLHSGLSDSQRAFYYDRIAQGQADVVVGPRSAIFAPTRKLGLVIVDEEHEPSYKQDTAPRYHGRDVAVMRGSLAGAAVILGSATPSLESLHNVQTGRYHLLSLPHRVRGLAMPKLQIVNLRRELTPGKIELLGRTLTLKIAAALDRREQIILLMNRRGYASYVFCPKCDWILGCDNCTRAMVFHQATQLAMCHYCQHTTHLPECCPACRGKILLFGFGIQRIEGELVRKFPGARTARMDSDTMTSPRQFQKIFEEFGAGEIDILLGTQMVGKGLDFPRVSLVGVVSADTSLTLPDFRAAERTFQLVVQVAGRAGRGETAGEVVVQTLHEDEPAIRFAATHDYQGFAASELPLRQEMGFPPFSRMVRMIVRHESVTKAAQDAERLGRSVAAVLPPQILMQGPMPCGVQKIRNLFRFQILLTAQRAGWIQQFLSPRLGEFCRDLEAEVIADVDPIALL
jgi:primosomal protein N' (replication factor Y)